ncbi:MAG: hypothetical protein LRZ87_00170 [Methanocellales archaeon]|nr:hypothetical protein [Methanocellales archaeon]
MEGQEQIILVTNRYMVYAPYDRYGDAETIVLIILSLSGIWYVKLTPIAPEPLPAPALIAIGVSKGVYLTGEPVEFTIKNIGNSTIHLPTTAPWYGGPIVHSQEFDIASSQSPDKHQPLYGLTM